MTSAAKVGIVMLIALAVLGYFILRIEDISLSRSKTTHEVKAIFDELRTPAPRNVPPRLTAYGAKGGRRCLRPVEER